MYKLYYMPLNFYCRAARIILFEKGIPFEIINEPYWKRRVEFLRINPAGDLPVVVDDENISIVGYEPLVEYLDEKKIGKTLLGNNSRDSLEARRLCFWVGRKLQKEVMENILDERVFNSLKENSQPSTIRLKAGRKNLKNHMDYFEWILDRRSFVVGDYFTVADISLASALSSLDYLNEVDWKNFEKVKNWYATIKSRPSFRDILEESIYNIAPSLHYKDLDF